MTRPSFISRAALVLSLAAPATFACSGTPGDSSDPDGASDMEAQADADASPEVSERVQELTEELSLTPEQSEEVAEIMAGSHARMQELHERAREAHEAGAERERMEEQMKEFKEEGRLLKEEHADRMRAVLNPEQIEKFEEIRARHHAHHGKGKHHGKGMHAPHDPAKAAAKLKEKLGLSDEQATKVQAVFTESAPAREALHAKKKAVHEEFMKMREDGADEAALEAKKAEFEPMKTEAKALHDAQADKVRAILTEEQRAKYDEFVEAHERKRAKGHHGGGHGGPHGAHDGHHGGQKGHHDGHKGH